MDKQRNELRAERDEAIRKAHQGNLPMEDIGEVIGLSFPRVRQIVRS